MRLAVFRRIPTLAVGLVSIAVLLAVLAIVGPGAAGPASAATNRCPNSNAIKLFKQATNVAASFSNAGNVTTYTFFSLTNENPVGGVPGLIDYCVYPTAGTAAPTNVTPLAKGADGALWKDPPDINNFSFVRPDGDKSNIPLDGKTTTMGTATWAAAPNDQTILLHINDPAVCKTLYGNPGSPGGSQGGGLFPSNAPTWPWLPWWPLSPNDSSSSGSNSSGGIPGLGPFENTCFVTPGPSPTACDKGDTTLAYNANPFGAVNCFTAAFGFEAQQANEFGDAVGLAAGTPRGLKSLDVVFGVFSCTSGSWTGTPSLCGDPAGQTFHLPVTANIYDANLTKIATVTQDVTFPYRPGADTTGHCTDPNPGDPNYKGKFFNPAGVRVPPLFPAGRCQSALGVTVTFTFPAGTTLPDQVVWTVAFNTSTAGYNPVPCASQNGPNCPYDSLNVGTTTFANAPYAGTDVVGPPLNDPGPVDGWHTTVSQPSPLTLFAIPGNEGRPLGAIRTQ